MGSEGSQLRPIGSREDKYGYSKLAEILLKFQVLIGGYETIELLLRGSQQRAIVKLCPAAPYAVTTVWRVRKRRGSVVEQDPQATARLSSA